MQHPTRTILAAVTALAAMAAAGPARAAAADYFLKIDGIEGEASSAAADGHSDWIEIVSLRYAGGVNVASGDVNGDGAAPGGQASGRRTYEPVIIRKRIDRSSPAAPSGPPGRVAAPPEEPQAIGLLLPAVQKIRSTTARMHAWRGCAVGQHVDGVTLREAATGRTVRVLDATVTECAMEQVSFNFSKVE